MRAVSRLIATCVVALLIAVWLWPHTGDKAPLTPRIVATHHATSLLPQFAASHGAQIRIAATADGFSTVLPEKKPAQGRWRNPAKPVVATFPRDFVNPVRVQSGSADVAARPLNAHSSTGRIAADGSLCYPDAFERCDVLYRSSEFKTEEFLVVHALPAIATDSSPLPLGERADVSDSERGVRGNAVRQWSWQLDTHGLTPRLTPAHTIELCDEAGVPRLRINAPEGCDAAKKPLRAGKELTLALAGDVLTLAADLRGCEFPVVIDPTWTSTGAMAVERRRHKAVLLLNGNLLVTGGVNRFGDPHVTCELFDTESGSWKTTGSTTGLYDDHQIARLLDGRVIVIGATTCERYDPIQASWSATGSLLTARSYLASAQLSDGNVMVIGGDSSGNVFNNCEIYDSSGVGSWTATASLNIARRQHSAVLIIGGKVLVSGGVTATGATTSSELYTPGGGGAWSVVGPLQAPQFMHQTIVMSTGDPLITGVNFIHNCQIFDRSTQQWSVTAALNVSDGSQLAKLGNGLIVSAGGNDYSSGPINGKCEIFSESTRTWLPTATMASPRLRASFTTLADGRALIAGGEATASTTFATCEVFNSNDPPTVVGVVSPSVIAPGESVAFSATGSDLNGDALTYSWDFGDGSSSSPEQNPAHTYTVAGTYTATVTVKDPGNLSASATVTITVVTGRPTPRFTTSDIVGFAGQPFTFDASLSTDPQNGIVSYAWNFGDGSPAGAGQVISKIYAAEGTYLVRLDVADNDGLIGSAQREIVILPAEQLGKVNSAIAFKTKFDRDKENADSLMLDAVVNVGADTPIAAGAAVAFEIAGQRFEGSLNTRLQDYSNKNEKWQVKAGTRKQAAGEVALKLALKKASLGLGFNQAGVLPGDDGGEVDAAIPVKLEIAGRTFEVVLDATFKFNKKGKKASGEGN